MLSVRASTTPASATPIQAVTPATASVVTSDLAVGTDATHARSWHKHRRAHESTGIPGRIQVSDGTKGARPGTSSSRRAWWR